MIDTDGAVDVDIGNDIDIDINIDLVVSLLRAGCCLGAMQGDRERADLGSAT